MASPRGRAARDHSPPSAQDGGDREIVDVNVGGVHFSTTRHTLCSAVEPRSMLAAMFRGDSLPSRTDRHGCVFIDRDGSRFRQVLNYLRSGTIHCDPDRTTLSELLEEAEYFGLDRLRSMVQEELNRIELEDDLESMPYSSQQSDTSVAPPSTDSTPSPGRPKLSSSDSQANYLYSSPLSSAAMNDASETSTFKPLLDYTFTLNADF